MGQNSGIEWTEASWNPIAGCTRVSAGCANCYAERMTWRLVNNPATAGVYENTIAVTEEGPRWSGQLNLIEGRLTWPLHWREPRMIFVCSMSDLFHPKVPFEFVDRVFAVIGVARRHTYQILTKRPHRMAEYMNTPGRGGTVLSAAHRMALAGVFGADLQALQRNVRILDLTQAPWPLPHVWLGVSVEDQRAADERISELLPIAAAVRFVSAEPLLGPIDFDPYDWDWLGSLDWVIVGGESGPGARPMHSDWPHSLRDQCQAAGVPFFFKQWGAWAPCYEASEGWFCLSEHSGNEIRARISHRITMVENEWDERLMARVGKNLAGRLLDGREWNEFPAVGQHPLEANTQ